jgi:hypothetical protein
MYCINVGDRKRKMQMGYLIYDRKTTAIASKVYKTHAAALAQLTRMGKGQLQTDPNHPIYCYGVAEKEYYFRHIERKVVRVNLMSGVEYEESVNTPLVCSPASETYWSM